MFTSSICKHINKWGRNKGNICGKSSKKKDSRCHKHRYRFLKFIYNIYTSMKYLFDIKPIRPVKIKNKKQIKKLLEKKEYEFKNRLEYEKNNEKLNIKKNENENFQEYIERMDRYTDEILKIKEEKIVYRLIIDRLYEELNYIYSMGTREWVINANLILKIKKKYFYHF